MKRVMLVLAILSTASSLFAVELYRSSFTQTADSNQPLCTVGKRSTLYSICVSSPIAGATTTIFVSTNTPIVNYFTVNNTFGCIGPLNVPVISTNAHSLAYTTAGTAGVSIQYNCY